MKKILRIDGILDSVSNTWKSIALFLLLITAASFTFFAKEACAMTNATTMQQIDMNTFEFIDMWLALPVVTAEELAKRGIQLELYEEDEVRNIYGFTQPIALNDKTVIAKIGLYKHQKYKEHFFFYVQFSAASLTIGDAQNKYEDVDMRFMDFNYDDPNPDVIFAKRIGYGILMFTWKMHDPERRLTGFTIDKSKRTDSWLRERDENQQMQPPAKQPQK